ncbi:diacylglycerol/lipid kinase family protein [Vermiculatibacterium agrestimuris]|uniref:diacylglycerol/lipid kinase family protein n=1 Tax=Vermiculatibacterium agrestimuris TaxID=2941519 RepID=UPI00203F78D7|nr:diacylglycerol kinase family protein [Vermiculatibacterium agrestimuris]
MEKLLFIYNPHAGKGRVRGKLAGILNAFTRSGQLVTAYPTQGPGDAARCARELSPDHDRIAVCGGDGTLHEVITGLMELPESARPPIGYIPAGTTNDFARNLGLPKGMEEMAALAASGEPRSVDIGRLGERYFTYVAALGAFTDVSYNTPQQFKNIFGHLAYVLKGASELANLQSYPLRVEHDGGVLEGDFLYVMVSNTVSVGGLIGLPAEEVSLDDGLLEAVLVRMPQTVAQMNAAIYALARQEYDQDSGVTGLHSSRFLITCAKPVPFTLDGEFGGAYTQADIAAVNTPIRIVYGQA